MRTAHDADARAEYFAVDFICSPPAACIPRTPEFIQIDIRPAEL